MSPLEIPSWASVLSFCWTILLGAVRQLRSSPPADSATVAMELHCPREPAHCFVDRLGRSQIHPSFLRLYLHSCRPWAKLSRSTRQRKNASSLKELSDCWGQTKECLQSDKRMPDLLASRSRILGPVGAASLVKTAQFQKKYWSGLLTFWEENECGVIDLSRAGQRLEENCGPRACRCIQ
jgi:hypothetical protein